MLQRERAIKSLEQAKQDFEQFRRKPEFTKDDEEQLINDLTDLLGWYNINPAPELEQFIKQMISFGEKKLWSMAGSRIQFEHVKTRHAQKGGS